MLEQARKLNELFDNQWEGMGCFERSSLLVAMRDVYVKIDPENLEHYDVLLELDNLAMKMGVFIAPDGTIERVGPTQLP
jgi:hypothetical protein